MGLSQVNSILRSAKDELAEGQMFVIGAGGLSPVETGKMTMMPGVMYPMGASSSPKMILMTKVDDKFLHYKDYPWTKGTKEMRIDRRVGEHLILQGTKTWLSGPYPKYQPDRAKSLRSMLGGGKGKKENVADFEQVTMLVKPVASGDLWRAAEEYGNVAGITDPKTGVEHYEIMGTARDLKKLKKDKRFAVVKTAAGHQRVGF